MALVSRVKQNPVVNTASECAHHFCLLHAYSCLDLVMTTSKVVDLVFS